jgi:poly(3-hydroxybutyrate) depolymerase
VTRCPRHDLALAPDGTCVVCRRASTPPPQPPRRLGALLVVLVALVGVAAIVFSFEHFRASAPAAQSSVAASVTGTLATTNSAGRRGAYFLPAGYQDHALPLLVALHGTGGSGAMMVGLFRKAAESQRFVIVAPDSRIAPNGQPSWEVPSKPGETTEDADHIRRCVDELRAMPGVRIDDARTLIAGHSGGASTAPYVASTDELYSAFAVLHGGAFPGGLGPRRVRGWFSTGDSDPLRPASRVGADASAVRAAGFDAVVFRTFKGGHDVGPEELDALMRWWLGG